MKRIFLFLLTCPVFFLVMSCDGSAEYTVTVTNQNPAAYFIAVRRDDDSGSDFIGYINQNESKDFKFEKGTVIRRVEFYSGMDPKTMRQVLRMTYDREICSDTVLLLGDGKVSRR